MTNKEKKKAETPPPKRTVEKTRHPEFIKIYINSSQVQIGTFDVRLSLGTVPDDENPEDDVIRLEERVQASMSPQHAKALAQLLVANVRRYEAEFGPINLKAKSAPDNPTIIESD
jgi:hypothetical protein